MKKSLQIKLTLFQTYNIQSKSTRQNKKQVINESPPLHCQIIFLVQICSKRFHNDCFISCPWLGTSRLPSSDNGTWNQNNLCHNMFYIFITVNQSTENFLFLAKHNIYIKMYKKILKSPANLLIDWKKQLDEHKI